MPEPCSCLLLIAVVSLVKTLVLVINFSFVLTQYTETRGHVLDLYLVQCLVITISDALVKSFLIQRQGREGAV